MLSARDCVGYYVCIFLSVDCVVTFSQASYSVTEDDILNISIMISNALPVSISVIVLGTGQPYHLITILGGNTSVTFDACTAEDNICADDETFILTLDTSFLPNDCVVGNPGSATVTVVNDDGGGMFLFQK